MTKNELTVWGIHAGKTGDADALFLRKHVVAIGWEAMGDLATLAPDREAFKARAQKVHPDAKPGAIPLIGGQNFRLVHEAQAGDLIAYPSQHDKKIHVGRIDGPYRYDPDLEPGYPSLRPVKWLHSLPRTDFSQGALYEIGCAMSFFQLKTYAEEFIAASQGKHPTIEVKQDPTVALVASDVEQSTKDYLLKTLTQNFKGHRFAHLVGDLLVTMGYRTRVSPEGTGQGHRHRRVQGRAGASPADHQGAGQERRGERRVARGAGARRSDRRQGSRAFRGAGLVLQAGARLRRREGQHPPARRRRAPRPSSGALRGPRRQVSRRDPAQARLHPGAGGGGRGGLNFGLTRAGLEPEIIF